MEPQETEEDITKEKVFTMSLYLPFPAVLCLFPCHSPVGFLSGSRWLRALPAAHPTLGLGAVRRVEARQRGFPGEENPAESRTRSRDLQAHLRRGRHHLGHGSQVRPSRMDDCDRAACASAGREARRGHAGLGSQPGELKSFFCVSAMTHLAKIV